MCITFAEFIRSRLFRIYCRHCFTDFFLKKFPQTQQPTKLFFFLGLIWYRPHYSTQCKWCIVQWLTKRGTCTSGCMWSNCRVAQQIENINDSWLYFFWEFIYIRSQLYWIIEVFKGDLIARKSESKLETVGWKNWINNSESWK